MPDFDQDIARYGPLTGPAVSEFHPAKHPNPVRVPNTIAAALSVAESTARRREAEGNYIHESAKFEALLKLAKTKGQSKEPIGGVSTSSKFGKPRRPTPG